MNLKFLSMLVCPISKSALVYHDGELISISAKIAYRIKNDIPIMLPENARRLSDIEIDKILSEQSQSALD